MSRLLNIAAAIAVVGTSVQALRSSEKAPGGARRQLLADAGTSKRFRLFPDEKVRAKMSRWELIVQHSGPSITKRDVAAVLPALVIDPSESSTAAGVRVTTVNDMPAPSEDEMRLFSRGFNEAQRAAVANNHHGTLLAIQAVTGAEGLRILRQTQVAIVKLARMRNGFIWDETTRELFTPDAFEEKRVRSWTERLPYAIDHFTIHVYRKEQLFRLVTLGMQKFGLPDLTVEDTVSTKAMANLVILVGQTLLEGRLPKAGKLHVDLDAIALQAARERLTGELLNGATKSGDLFVLEGKPEKGDPENSLMELWFGEPAQEQQDRILSQIWGSTDKVTLPDGGREGNTTAKLPMPAPPR